MPYNKAYFFAKNLPKTVPNSDYIALYLDMVKL